MRSYRRRVPARRVQAPMRRTTQTRRAFGNFASAMQQRDSANIVISKQEDVKIVIPVNCGEATLVRNVTALLCGTEYFGNYVGMYDQFKLNAVRASMEMTDISSTLLTATRYPQICTSWDRNGIKISTVDARAAAAPNPVYAYSLPQYSDVASYSSANEKTLYYGSRWGVIRQLDAASMMEKSIYLPTTNTRDVLTHSNMYSAWNPQLLISIKTPTIDATAERTATISIHWQFDVTLRGLRKVPTTVMNRYMPNGGFIGYARTNFGIAVLKNGAVDGQPGAYAVVGNIVGENNAVPTINPEYEMPVGAGNGLVVPNTGLPDANKGL